MSDQYAQMPKVISKIDDFRFVINRGSDHQIKVGSTYLIFRLGGMMVDPDTLENLGLLEIVIGRAKVVHVQAKVSTLESIELEIVPGSIKKVKKTGALAITAFGGHTVEETEEGSKTYKKEIETNPGDYARPI